MPKHPFNISLPTIRSILPDLYSVPSNVQALGCHFISLAHMHSIDYLPAGNKTTVLPTVVTGKAQWFRTRG
jgi:hypothetical protein